MIFNKKKKKLNTYLELLAEIEHREFLMPIEEIRLGNQFAELKDVNLLKEHLLTDHILNNPNFHVKRIVAIAFRNLEEYNDAEINSAMKNFLNEDAHWVVYDAIWYFQEANTKNPEIIDKIKSLLNDTVLTDEQKAEGEVSSDPTVNMVEMARETLELLE